MKQFSDRTKRGAKPTTDRQIVRDIHIVFRVNKYEYDKIKDYMKEHHPNEPLGFVLRDIILQRIKD